MCLKLLSMSMFCDSSVFVLLEIPWLCNYVTIFVDTF